MTYDQFNWHVSVKSANGNNSYDDICEVTTEHLSFRSDVIHKDLKLKCFGETSQKPL